MEKLKYTMVGGDKKSFIGNVHRDVLRLDPRVQAVSGCFSRDPEKCLDCGNTFGIPESRLFTDWKKLVEDEKNRDNDRADLAVICTPNRFHYEMCLSFLEAGINVVCEKPLCFTVSEAETLCRKATEKGLVFAVTYTYTGYVMVKVMREMIKRGEIGKIVSVNAEYVQDWLLDELGSEKEKNDGIWRTDPNISGPGNSVGDIGTHIENLVSYTTGMKIKKLIATCDRFGKTLDYNDNIIVEYENGVHGAYWCTQVAAGKGNGLKIGVFGTEGAIEWEQHFPDRLIFTKKGDAPRILDRGTGAVHADAAEFSSLPGGHPEGFHCAFRNIYKNVVSTVLAKKSGRIPTESETDFPTVFDGAEGVRFVDAVLRSAENGSNWVDF